MFRNRQVKTGESVMHFVSADDEWVAEAYMETDYSSLKQADFERVLLDYAVFSLSRSTDNGNEVDAEADQ